MTTHTKSPTSWRDAIPQGLGPREDHPRSMRWPKDLAERVEKIGGAASQDFSTTAIYLITAAVEEYERREEKKGKAS